MSCFVTFLCCVDTMFAIWVSWSPDIKSFGSNVSPVQPEDLYFFPIKLTWKFHHKEMTADFTQKKNLKFLL